MEVAKKYIERKYLKNFEEEKQRKAFFDKITRKMHKLNLTDKDKHIIQNKLEISHQNNLRQKRKK